MPTETMPDTVPDTTPDATPDTAVAFALPARIRGLAKSAADLAGFLERTAFPDAGASRLLRDISDEAGLIAAHDRSRALHGLADFAEATIRRVHSSVGFHRHVTSGRLRADGVRVPRLRSLVPAAPAPADWRTEVLGAMARTLAATPPEGHGRVLDFYLYGTRFAELDGDDYRDSAIGALFRTFPAAGLALFESRATADLPELHGPLLLAGCRYFSANRHFRRCVALCERYLEEIGPEGEEREEILDQLWYAAFRLGRIDTARAALLDWTAHNPLLKRPLVYLSIVESTEDPEAALALLDEAGAPLGRATVGGNTLYAETMLRRGETGAAARAIRAAFHEAERLDMGRPDDYMIALHNLGLAQGRPSRALDSVFVRHNLRLEWERFGLDTVTDRSPGTGRVESGGQKVAVVMTAYQAERYLARAMQGVLEQSHPDLTLIVVDDCSDDGTAAIAQGTGDDRVRYMRTPRNVGTYVAKNIGIRQALADGAAFVALCDSDDFWLRTHLAHHLIAMAETPDALCSTSQWLRIRDDGSVECGLRGRYVETCPHSTFFRATVFGRIGFFDAVRFGADREFLNRLHLHAGRAAVVALPRILTLGRRHDASLTTSGAGAIGAFNDSPVRLDYWQGWNDWHLEELRAGRLPVFDGKPETPRPFPLPEGIGL